jgi:hypothetical protein
MSSVSQQEIEDARKKFSEMYKDTKLGGKGKKFISQIKHK